MGYSVKRYVVSGTHPTKPEAKRAGHLPGGLPTTDVAVDATLDAAARPLRVLLCDVSNPDAFFGELAA